MEELYKIYDDSVTIQKKAIQAANSRLKAAKQTNNISEIKRLSSLLMLLYQEKWELEEKRREIKKYLT